MSGSLPPRLADWLLLRLVYGPRRQSLIGDLHEQYERGRSAPWYWRQSIKAILAGVWSDLRWHPAELTHALCAGLGALVLYNLLIVSPAWWLIERIALDHELLRRIWVFPWAWWPIALIAGWISGRVVMRFHSERLGAALFLLLLSQVVTNLPRLFSLSADAWGYPNYRPQLWFQIVTVMVPSVGILIGGLSDLRPSEQNFQINNRISTE